MIIEKKLEEGFFRPTKEGEFIGCAKVVSTYKDGSGTTYIPSWVKISEIISIHHNWLIFEYNGVHDNNFINSKDYFLCNLSVDELLDLVNEKFIET